MKADLKALLAKITNCFKADYVIEVDTDGTWYWRKWKSGLAECWAHSTGPSNAPNWHITLPAWVVSIISVTTSSYVTGRTDTTDGYTQVSGTRVEHYSQPTVTASRGCRVYCLCTWKTFESGSI